MELALSITICVLLLIAIIMIIVFRNKSGNDPASQTKFIELQTSLSKIESGFKEDFRLSREENANNAKNDRVEINNSLKTITEQSQNALK
jgi:hypothetical protein